MNPLEDFPAPFTSKHLKNRTKHSLAKYSATETKPLIPTEECEHDLDHKHMALVLSIPQHDDLCQVGAPHIGNGFDIPLTRLPTFSPLVSNVTNRLATNLQKSASSSDLKAAVSNLDNGYTPVQGESEPLNDVHSHTIHFLHHRVSPELDGAHRGPDVDGAQPRQQTIESFMEAPSISTSQSETCHEHTPLQLAPGLQTGDSSKQCSHNVDLCITTINQNSSVNVKDNRSTSVNSNLSDKVTSYNSPSREDESTCLVSRSCSLDGTERTIKNLQSPCKESIHNTGTSKTSLTPEAAYVPDQCIVSFLSEENEPVKTCVAGIHATCEEPNQINSLERKNANHLPGHRESCPNNTSSLFLHYPHSCSLNLSHTSSAPQIDRHNPSTSIKAPVRPDIISEVSYAYNVKADTDANQTSAEVFPGNTTQAVHSACPYPSVCDIHEAYFYANGFRKHHPQFLNSHGKVSDCRIFLSQKPQPTNGHGYICGSDFASTAPCSKIFNSAKCGCDKTDISDTQISGLQKSTFLTHSPKMSKETHQDEQTHPNPPDWSFINADLIHCKASPTTQGQCSLNSCTVNMLTSQLPLSDMVPSYINHCAGNSPTAQVQAGPRGPACHCDGNSPTAQVQAGPRGPACHCDQHLSQRTSAPGDNSINNMRMPNSIFSPKLTLSSNRASLNDNVLDSKENLAGCQGDNERNSVLSSIDSVHHGNKEGSLPRSNTSEVGLLKVDGNASSDREVPNYAILCIVATILNPVFGLAALLCNHYAQINFRLHRRAQANNLYFATITISTVAIFLTLVGAVLLVTHVAVIHSEAKFAATTPSIDQCESRLFGYDESLKTFFNIDFHLYCEITKNEKIMDALKRFWLEDIHNVEKYENIKSSSKNCNDTQNGHCGDSSSANGTFPESSFNTKDSLVNLQPAEGHRNSESSATEGNTPQISKPSENSAYSHNTILSSNDGPVVPPELEEEYRQFLEGHTRTKVGSGHPILHGSVSDTNLPSQTPGSMEENSTTDTTSSGNATFV